jgi:hypothetical protein
MGLVQECARLLENSAVGGAFSNRVVKALLAKLTLIGHV